MIMQTVIDNKLYEEFKELAIKQGYLPYGRYPAGFKHLKKGEKFSTFRDRIIKEAIRKYIEDNKK